MSGIPARRPGTPVVDCDSPGSSRENAVLSNPREPTRTEAERQEAARIQREQERDTARGVARHAMRDAHGCTGRGCPSPAHAADREARDELLRELG
jgi:hypothetical protein